MLQRTRLQIALADLNICYTAPRCIDPVVACEKIKLATDQRFSCYDRQEESIDLMNYDMMKIGYGY